MFAFFTESNTSKSLKKIGTGFSSPTKKSKLNSATQRGNGAGDDKDAASGIRIFLKADSSVRRKSMSTNTSGMASRHRVNAEPRELESTQQQPDNETSAVAAADAAESRDTKEFESSREGNSCPQSIDGTSNSVDDDQPREEELSVEAETLSGSSESQENSVRESPQAVPNPTSSDTSKTKYACAQVGPAHELVTSQDAVTTQENCSEPSKKKPRVNGETNTAVSSSSGIKLPWKKSVGAPVIDLASSPSPDTTAAATPTTRVQPAPIRLPPVNAPPAMFNQASPSSSFGFGAHAHAQYLPTNVYTPVMSMTPVFAQTMGARSFFPGAGTPYMNFPMPNRLTASPMGMMSPNTLNMAAANGGFVTPNGGSPWGASPVASVTPNHGGARTLNGNYPPALKRTIKLTDWYLEPFATSQPQGSAPKV